MNAPLPRPDLNVNNVPSHHRVYYVYGNIAERFRGIYSATSRTALRNYLETLVEGGSAASFYWKAAPTVPRDITRVPDTMPLTLDAE